MILTDKVWRWNCKLSWELFSSAVYDYRNVSSEKKVHRKHAMCKNGLFSSVTAVEAYLNEVLSQEEKWSQNKLKKPFKDKLRFFDLDFPEYEAKTIRNNFLVHHKRIDQRYFVEINSSILLNSIETAQEIIARICFKRGVIFPYWITGVNFVNPSHDLDISLSNEYEFWRHISRSKLFNGVDKIIDSAGNIYLPSDWKDYKYLYYGLWEMLKESNFHLDALSIKDDRFPKMPYLTVKYWE